jgi:hypothetical protein
MECKAQRSATPPTAEKPGEIISRLKLIMEYLAAERNKSDTVSGKRAALMSRKSASKQISSWCFVPAELISSGGNESFRSGWDIATLLTGIQERRESFAEIWDDHCFFTQLNVRMKATIQ